ncbi:MULTISPECIES: COG3904 family protein [Gammaproteobacteria]|uniref:COG3904 family protein n=1 Tax=Gammaproteobacteria TaxID=1236 RepID=UPI0019142FFC|nr:MULTISPECIES: hypothetical protein [Gammaproteobacteria]MBK5304343.1 hypothetical protein [Bacillus sp. TH86]MBK5324112.1 hypothetical protein [Bacillus sp. TH59]MBK5339062.1 hypothetical protein [Bacillus sp. TH57]MBK5313111.1 hypothetical protein [Pseudomonas sp. TH71]MBK5318610.1 hypothetical protein [Erwinia sp. TH79]
MRRNESNTMRAPVMQLVAIALWSLACECSSAMTFDVVAMKGEPAILGRGGIVAGDATRFKAALTPNAKHSYGYYTLVLESPGGSVQAAFALSGVIDANYVNTYIAPGGRCISACAAIIFIAGREHVAVPGSYLGFHGCFNAQTRKIETLCNDAIAEHAIAHGTAYGAVMAFIEKIPSDEVVWISGSEADCWGINRYDISPKPVNYLQCVTNALKDLRR